MCEIADLYRWVGDKERKEITGALGHPIKKVGGK